MSSGARQITQIAKEVDVGVQPSPFARTALPFTTNGLNASPTMGTSETILTGRLPQKGALTEVNYAGDIVAELRFGVFDDLIAGAAYNLWVIDSPSVDSDTLTFGGDLKQSFSIVRGYTDVTRNGYHTFLGNHVNTMSLSIGVGQTTTITFGLMAMHRSNTDAPPAGTVTTPTLTPTFSGISVTDISIDDVTTVGVSCVTALEFTIDNTIQTQRCLGGGLDIGNLIATQANMTGSFTMAWANMSAELYEKQFTDQTIKLVAKMTDGDGNEYVLTLPKLQITAELPSGSKEDLLEVTYEYTVVEDAPTLTRTPNV